LLKLVTADYADQDGFVFCPQITQIYTDFFGVVSVICANLRNLWMNQSSGADAAYLHTADTSRRISFQTEAFTLFKLRNFFATSGSKTTTFVSSAYVKQDAIITSPQSASHIRLAKAFDVALQSRL
jgi:hypothetical protein